MLEKQIGQNILIVSGVRGDTRRYRTFHPYEQLQLLGIPSVLSHTTDPRLDDLARYSQVVIIHRAPYDTKVASLIGSVQDRGGLVLFDADDLTFWPDAFQWIDSPDFRDPIRARLYQEDLRRNNKTLLACQGMTASTGYLAEFGQSMGKTTWVNRNAFSLEMLACSERAWQNRPVHPGRVVIGYASGTPTHNRDFARIAPAIQAILLAYPDCELWTIGPLQLDSGWDRYQSQIQQYGWVPWRDFPGLLAQFDINLAPLVSDNPFGQSKSEIKYVEASLVRVPTIASPTDAFRFAIRDGENGFLAESIDDWYARLELLVKDADLREEVGMGGFQDVLNHYHPFVRGRELVEILSQARRDLTGIDLEWCGNIPQTQDAPVFIIEPGVEKQPSLIAMGFYNLRQRGILVLLRQIWVFLRRMIAPLCPYR